MINRSLKLVIILILTISLVGFLIGYFSSNWASESKQSMRTIVANLNLVLNVGEPIYIKRVYFGSIWPGQNGSLELVIDNLAPINYTIYISCKGVLAPNKNAILVNFNPKSVCIPGKSEVKVKIPYSVKSGAPIGVYELVIAIYRGLKFSNALLVAEVHLISYVGGEPIQIVSLEFPSLWPSSTGNFSLTVRNIANVAYNVSFVPNITTGPNNCKCIKISKTNIRIGGDSKVKVNLPVKVLDNAPVGTYIVKILVERG